MGLLDEAGAAVGPGDDRERGRVTPEPAGGLRREVGAIREPARPVGRVSQHVVVDVDHDRGRRLGHDAGFVVAAVKGAVADGDEGVGLAGPLGVVAGLGQRLAVVVDGTLRGTLRRRHDDRADRGGHDRGVLGGHAPLERDHPVGLDPPPEHPPLVTIRGGLVVEPARPPIPRHRLLEHRGGRVAGEVHEELLLVGLHRNPRDGPHLRIRQLPRREVLAHQGQPGQGVGDPEVLLGGAAADAAPPRQPVHARPAVPRPPRLPAVELRHEQQPPAHRRRDVAGQRRDLRCQPVIGPPRRTPRRHPDRLDDSSGNRHGGTSQGVGSEVHHPQEHRQEPRPENAPRNACDPADRRPLPRARRSSRT